jgi:DNA-binding NarL/FixJ family response regulator
VNRPRLVIADDHAVLAEGLRRLLEPEYEVLRLVADGESLVAACRELRPSIALADISMPRVSGIEATRRLAAECPGVRVVLLTMHDELSYALAALDEGASGFVLKTAPPGEVLDALRTVLAGGIYLSPTMNAEVLRARRAREGGGAAPRRALTERQRSVIRLLAMGSSAKEVATSLRMSVKTVEYHKYRTMKQLRITTSAGLVRYAIESGIAPSAPAPG